jgi:glycosyltransferase involved in cell wall biosynthesis
MRIGILNNTIDEVYGFNAGGAVHFLQTARYWHEHELIIYGPLFAREHILRELPGAEYFVMPSNPKLREHKALDFLHRLFFSTAALASLRTCDVIFAVSHLLPDTVPAALAKGKRSAAIVWHHVLPPWKRNGSYLNNTIAFLSDNLSLQIVRHCMGGAIAGSRLLLRESGLAFMRHTAITTNGVNHLIRTQPISHETFSRAPRLMDVGGFGSHFSLDQGAQGRRNAAHFKDLGDEEPAEKADRSRRRLLIEVPSSEAVYLGRLHPTKGVDDLIKAWRLVIAHVPNARLHIAGGGEASYVETLRALTRENGLSEHIRFLDEVSETMKAAVLASSKIFAFPSKEEGWGIVLAEAMATGLPCVTYDLPIFREVFSQGRRSAPVGDIPAFASAITALLQDDRARLALAVEAARLAETFTWDRAARIEIDLLQALEPARSQPKAR